MSFAQDFKLALRKRSTLSEAEKMKVDVLSMRIWIATTALALLLFGALYVDLMDNNVPGPAGLRMQEVVNGMALSIVTMLLVPWMFYGATRLMPRRPEMAAFASVVSAAALFFGSVSLIDVSLRLNTDLATINVTTAAYSSIVSVSNVDAFPADPAKCVEDAAAMIAGLGEVSMDDENSHETPKSCDRIFPTRKE